MHGNLTIERYAFILAHTLHFTPDDSPEVLARLGITPEDWEAAAKGWRTAMAAEVRREENARIMAFGAAFSVARARLREDRPELSSLGPLPEERALGKAGGEIVGAPGKPSAEDTISAPMMSATPRTSRTSEASDEPEDEGRMPQAASPMRGNFLAGSTMDAPPANAPSSWVSFPKSPIQLAHPAPSPLGGTSPLLDVPRGEVLPFAKGAAPPDLPTASSADSAELKPLPRAPEGLGETSLSLDVPRGPVLPFPSALPLPPPPGSSRASPPAASLPAASPLAAPPLSIERHASLCVELTVAPDRTQETLVRYRMTPEAKALADAYWKSRFEQDPEVRRTWEQAYNAYYAWLLSSGGKRGEPLR
jgi:hypothetical protein